MTLSNKVYIDLKKGDIHAFQRVFDAYSGSIFNLAYSILKNKEQAEEIVQETFLKVWLNHASIDATKDIWFYIYVIAKRLCFNEIRAIKYDKLAQKELLENMSILSEYINPNLADMQRLLDSSLSQLSKRQKQVWMMSREEGKSHKEIATELGISQNTVKNTMVQTLKSLRATFKEADYLYFFIFFIF